MAAHFPVPCRLGRFHFQGLIPPHWQLCVPARTHGNPQLGQICASEAVTLLCTLLSAHVRLRPVCPWQERLLTLVLKSTGPLPSCVKGGGVCRHPLPSPSLLSPLGPSAQPGKRRAGGRAVERGPGPLGFGQPASPLPCARPHLPSHRNSQADQTRPQIPLNKTWGRRWGRRAGPRGLAARDRDILSRFGCESHLQNQGFPAEELMPSLVTGGTETASE